MSRLDERLTDQFYAWERVGRGWQVYDRLIRPEPPFKPFLGHFLPEEPFIDDGRRPTILGSLVQKLGRRVGTYQEALPLAPEVADQPEPETLERAPLIELQAFLPAKFNYQSDDFEQFLLSISLCREPVTFELLGTANGISVQFAVNPDDELLVREQLQAFFSDTIFLPNENSLENTWESLPDDEIAVVEFGLAREFMIPLATRRSDSFVSIIGAMEALREEELGLFQVIFQPVIHNWSENILRSLSDYEDKPFFVNAQDLVKEARGKIARPLFAAIIRIAAKSVDADRLWQILRNLASALKTFARPGGNELIPLSNEGYPFEEHISDVLRRQSRRTGMLLNSEELTGFVHLPSVEVRSPRLTRHTQKTKAAPSVVADGRGLILGYNIHAGLSTRVALTSEQRVRHIHVIGGSGTGKSTLLYNLIRQDVENGAGLAVLDPHGDLVDKLLGVLPEKRIGDVILLDPSDEEFSVPFNILNAHSDLEKNLLASDLVSVFQRLSTSWGDQMGSVLQNAILAFLESSQGGTLSDLRRFLIERDFREAFLSTVHDPELTYYWRKGFPQLTGNKSIGPILTRLETFLAPKPIRYMVSQRSNKLDFASIMDSGKIFLAKLSQGLLGKENSFLLGSLIVSKFQQLAMARQRQTETARRDFTLYIDEFHNFITPSMAEILSGARKYRIGLVLAHQELRQLQKDPEVQSAVLSNAGTRICFRVGDDDARKLGEGFGFFEAKDLQNLSTGEAICRVERSDFDFNLKVMLPKEPSKAEATQRREQATTVSRKEYATPRTQIEATLRIPPRMPPETKSPPPSAPEVGPHPPVEEIPKHFINPPDLGRGGAQHQAIQKRIKEAAEALGFQGTIEYSLPHGEGSVDLLLKREKLTIACEISITTTTDHEVGNVAKCLKAGFCEIAIICLTKQRLETISRAVKACLGNESEKVKYFEPDQFIAELGTHSPKATEQSEKRRGYKIVRSVKQLTPEERKQREEAAIKSIAKLMKEKG